LGLRFSRPKDIGNRPIPTRLKTQALAGLGNDEARLGSPEGELAIAQV